MDGGRRGEVRERVIPLDYNIFFINIVLAWQRANTYENYPESNYLR